nr:MAG TPA: hypothetical protein [Caudoviricetes sp.]
MTISKIFYDELSEEIAVKTRHLFFFSQKLQGL